MLLLRDSLSDGVACIDEPFRILEALSVLYVAQFFGFCQLFIDDCCWMIKIEHLGTIAD